MGKALDEVQQNYPLFTYAESHVGFKGEDLHFSWVFTCGEHTFCPHLVIANSKTQKAKCLDFEALEQLAFDLGMVELLSYWKAFCSPTVAVNVYAHSTAQQAFWKNLWIQGLGEFFYVNGITPFAPELSYQQKDASTPRDLCVTGRNKVLIPVGGGKDSVLTLELLARSPYAVSTTSGLVGASKDCVSVFESQHTMDAHILFKRTIDPGLLTLNTQGFFNGHTPFSAWLAFETLCSASLFDIPFIALSNERSANEATTILDGAPINHQYSKSFEFEKDFQNYISSRYFNAPHYFSFLRPLYELQIVKLFSKLTDYHMVFKSCNVGQKTNSWCGRCAKCTFVALLLAAFMDDVAIHTIFDRPILDDESLHLFIDELIGIKPVKPFECVGTRDESRAALWLALKRRKGRRLPALLERYTGYVDESIATLESLALLETSFDENHTIPADLVPYLTSTL